jgi:phosphopantothenoylcysteine decarboxylase/phosphopantothenate--cysteine ligase
MLKGKRIVLGITGGIAAYKIAFLIRLLKKNGAEVRCVLTPASSDFITPLTVSTLSQNPAYLDFWNKTNGEWTNHVELGSWGDVMVIAPLTANSLAKMVNGYCDNLLTATYLSAKCPVMVAPAMDLDMYSHATTQSNLERIASQDVHVIPATSGFLASGLSGEGRMEEPETIFSEICDHFKTAQSMVGQKVLITAGPTYEAIDPVRFLGNHSSGKMGFELATACLKRGAEVILVTGPTKEQLSHQKLSRINVQSAQEMFEEVKKYFPSCTGGIFAAAVSDYRPKNVADQKMKKTADSMAIELVKNPDILQSTGKSKKQEQWLVGFALETNDALKHAAKKRKKKNLDFIVVNTLEDQGAGFGHDTNKITLLDDNNNSIKFELSSKKVVANNIVDYIIDRNK